MTKRFATVLLFVAAMLTNLPGLPAQQASTEKPERIASADLKKKLESGEKFLLIDVREDWELKADGAIAGAIHIPVAELDARMKDIPKDVQLIFY